MTTYPTRSMPIIKAKYSISMKKYGIYTLLLRIVLCTIWYIYNLLWPDTRKPSHGLQVVPMSFSVRKCVVIELDVEMPMCLTTSILFHNVITIISIPLNLRRDIN